MRLETKSPPVSATSVTSTRNALNDNEEVSAQLVWDTAPALPLLTIGINTYKRLPLLVEAVRSAVDQASIGPVEILIVDNDANSGGAEALMAAAPDLVTAPIRYFINDNNIGMYGSVNRCVTHARGEWLTILHDDDLLDPKFSSTILPLLMAGKADGIVCRKRTLDQRQVAQTAPEPISLMRKGRKVIERMMFGHVSIRPLHLKQMFWGNPAGNLVGFLARTSHFRDIGGFYAEEYPSCDYFFYARFCAHFRLAQLHTILVSIRIAENESLKPETLLGFLRTEYQMQQDLAGKVLPTWWKHISPWLIGYHADELNRAWRICLDPGLIDRELDISHKPGRHLWLQALRGASGGF